MRLHTALLFPIAALFLGGCSGLTIHKFPKTDSRGVPSYCSQIWTGNDTEQKLRHGVNGGAFGFIEKAGVVTRAGPASVWSASNYFYIQDGRSDLLPINNYNALVSGYAPWSISSSETNQLCAIKEAFENKKILFGSEYKNVYLNTDDEFSPEFFSSNSLLNNQYITDSEVAVYDKRNNAFLAKTRFLREKGESLASATERIYADLLNQSSTMLDRVHTGFYETQIPPIPKRPDKPTETILIKDTYETSAAFAKRVEDTRVAEVLAREQAANGYIKQLEERNTKILSLREEYTKALEMQRAENQRVVDWFVKEQKYLLKDIANAIVKNLTCSAPTELHLRVKNYGVTYDADLEMLNTHCRGIPTKVKMTVDEVQSFKDTSKDHFYDQKVDVEFKDGEMIIGKTYIRGEKTRWFEVIEDGSSSAPRKVEARIFVSPPKEDRTVELLDGELAIIPPKSGVWDSAAAMKVADLYNPKVPQWFSTPNSKEKIAYGTGLSLDEAKNDALRELAIMHSANISVKQSTKTKVKGTPSAEVTSEKEVNVSTNKSYTGSYRIIKQEPMDGRWYVSIQAQK
jgi:hypothetical protein